MTIQKSPNVIDKRLPVCRMGNVSDPKIVILTYNPKLQGEYETWPEYKMNEQGLYSDTNMQFSDFRKLCHWWENVLKNTDEFVSDRDVLYLELYPYRSNDCNVGNPRNWGDYEKKSLVKNVEILRKCIEKNLIIIGYYYGEWEAMFPELKFDLYPYYCRCNALSQSGKLSKMYKFLKSNQDYLKRL